MRRCSLFFKKFLDYGEKVAGYEIGVLNEREVRAAAGIMFLFGIMTIFLAIGFNHIILARIYLSLFWVDFLIRLIEPKYSPMLLLARVFVQNQTPEYTGAVQKRFAWLLGWIISFPMMDWFVLHWEITFYKVLICVLCLSLLFLEGALSICVGCKLYEWFTNRQAQHCPGGSCEIRNKEPIQRFNPLQKVIATIMIVGIVVGAYLFMARTESKTFFGEFLHKLVVSKSQLKAEEDAAFEKQAEMEMNDDF